MRVSVSGWFLRGFHIWTSRHGSHITSRAAVVHVCSSSSLPPRWMPMYLPILNSSFHIPHILSLPSSLVLSFSLCLFFPLYFYNFFLKHPIPSPLSSKPLLLHYRLCLALEISHHSPLLRKPFFSN